MPATTTLPGSFHLAYDPLARRLHGCWLAPTDDAGLRAHYTDLLTAACAHANCRFWLLDLRRRNWYTPEFGHWYSQVFALAAHAALRQPVFIAYVLSPAHYVRATHPSVQATQRGCVPHGVYPFFFDSEAAAAEWLMHQQALDS